MAAVICHVLSAGFSQLGYGTGDGRSYQVDHSRSPNCRCVPALRPVTRASQNAGTASHFGRFSPSETQCRAGVSASSPLCFERVNPHPGTSHLVEPAPVPTRALQRPRCPPPLRSPDRALRRASHHAHPEPARATERRPSPDRTLPARRRTPDSRVAPLRGAGVQISGRRVGQVVLGIVLATLAVLVVVFTIVGVHNNQQNDQLHNQGVPVTFTVTGCLGLLGGSGSNAAGYTCRGTYELDGHRYNERLPGTVLHAPGDRGPRHRGARRPALVSPASIVDDRALLGVGLHPPGRPVRGPVVLLVVLALRRRRTQAGESDAPTLSDGLRPAGREPRPDGRRQVGGV